MQTKTFGKRGLKTAAAIQRPSHTDINDNTDTVGEEDGWWRESMHAFVYKLSGALFAFTIVLFAIAAVMHTGDGTENAVPSEAAPAEPTYDSTRAVFAAETICNAMDRTGVTTAPCEVSGWDSSITIYAPMTIDQARSLCSDIVGSTETQELGFFHKWKFVIRSPYNGGQSIAWCTLP